MNFYINENEIVPLTNEYEVKIEHCKRLFALTKKQTVEQLKLTSETFKTMEMDLNMKYKSVLKPGKYGVNTNESKLIVIHRKMRDTLDKYQGKIQYMMKDLNKPEPVYEVENNKMYNGSSYGNWYYMPILGDFKTLVHTYSYQTKKIKGSEIQVGDYIVRNSPLCYRSEEVLKVVKITKSCIFYDILKAEKVAEDNGFAEQSFHHTLMIHILNDDEFIGGSVSKMGNKGYFKVVQGNPSYVLTERVFDYGN